MNPLVLPGQEYRVAYLRIAQLALDFLETIDQRPCFPNITGVESVNLFAQSLPDHGMGPSALDDLRKVIEASRPPSPRFFGYVLGSGEPIAAAADLLASVLNQNVTAWRSGPAAAAIEGVTIDWLAQSIGCRGYVGSLTGGGSIANLMGLAMAREKRSPANEAGVYHPGTVYASEQVHMSIPKAVALLGQGRRHLRLVPCDDEFRIRLDLLQTAIDDDLRAGIIPIAVVGSAGTVNTGSVDRLRELAAIAKSCGAWFHVDGAYGALASIARPELFDGLD